MGLMNSSMFMNLPMIISKTKKIGIVAKWKTKAKALKHEITALYLASRDPRTPWYAKAFMFLVLAYAISPIDLIPDFIPVVGYLDDLIIIPAGIYLAIKMIPSRIMQECREKAQNNRVDSKIRWIGLSIILAVWALVIILIVRLIM